MVCGGGREGPRQRARQIDPGEHAGHVTTDHVLVETWLLLNSRFRREVAEQFWDSVRRGDVTIEPVTAADLEAAWAIGAAIPDQDFSIVDRTSFAVMERVASFNGDFAVYRYGHRREKAFELVRSGQSEAFRLFHRAILEQKQITCTYKGLYRELCPIFSATRGGRNRLSCIRSEVRAPAGCRPRANGVVSILPMLQTSKSAAARGIPVANTGRGSNVSTGSTLT